MRFTCDITRKEHENDIYKRTFPSSTYKHNLLRVSNIKLILIHLQLTVKKFIQRQLSM
jgi:hypothetical protein